MSNELAIVALAAGAYLLLNKRSTVLQPGQQANGSAWTNRYFQSPATAYYPTATQQRESSQAQLVSGGFGVLSQLINKWNAPSVSAPSVNYSAPDSSITNEAPSMPDYSSTDSGQAGDLSDWWG